MITTKGLIRFGYGVFFAIRKGGIEFIQGTFDIMDFINYFPEGWRIVTLVVGLIKAKEKRQFLMNKPWHSKELSCTDMASAWQLFPPWEKEVKEILDELKHGLFIDVGANIGFYTRRMALNGNKVIAFEASLTTYRYLQETIRMNKLQNAIIAFRLACWNKPEILKIGGNDHSSMKRITSEGNELVNATRLDDIITKQPDIVKIDTEGSEPNILAGMPRILKRGTRIVFEAWTPGKLSLCKSHLEGYQIRQIDAINYYAIPIPKVSSVSGRILPG